MQGWMKRQLRWGGWGRHVARDQGLCSTLKSPQGLRKRCDWFWSFAFLHRRIGVCRKKTRNFDGFSYDRLGHRVNPISCYFLLPDLLFTQRVYSISITGSASFCINWVVFFTETKEVTCPSAFPVQASGS